MENFSMIDFNYFDVVIATIVLLLGIKGFMHGFIKEAFGLVGLIGGVYFASRLSGTAAAFIDTNFLHLENQALLKLVGFLAILIIIWLSATVVGSIFSKLTSASGLGFLNRMFGFIAGGGKYFLIFALIVTALSNVSLVKDNLEKHVENSILYPYLKQAGSFLINLDPSTLGLESTSTTEVIKEVINLNESNTTEVTAIQIPETNNTEINQSESNQSTLTD
ncbi:MAG: colicin V synthesis protein [Sulfurovum sp.]|nr:MAG: colicin V synthesis protein [Sulfurovum sp.]